MSKPIILIVDDKPLNIEFIAELMMDQYDIRVATNGEERLSFVQSITPALILLDILMPIKDGFTTAQELKATYKTKDIPIIFITASIDEESIEKAYSLGASDYITKPFKPKELLARVDREIKLNTLVKDLDRQVKIEVEKNLKTQKLLIQQSKLAEMGSMIGIIAHQWKQPLNILSLNSQSLKIRYQSNQLNENTIDLIIKKFLTQIEFMSDTIDDFKNFFSISKEKMEFRVHEEIQSIIKILESKIHSHDIKISINKKFDCSITSYKNEFKQALFNIINNMIDIFDERVIENPYIKIDIEYDYMDCVITLHDNGGGIATQLLPERLFEPYVTTKGETGTGIGLQITKDIIINSFNGEIKASNVDNGAQFIIKLPLIT